MPFCTVIKIKSASVARCNLKTWVYFVFKHTHTHTHTVSRPTLMTV